ncbi:conserved Plasmodium protein, unknown function [Plasmodium gallinaceum]|uniref:Uncharacterized protein n=1 Tax=Plasmodium gallinaceum TaxID=5849 RepID=A0A1J1GZJ0_PLAGA|nr:conserved Plasmodium protein, unknown function [Plasmodium gallinaceum]CRG96713.1 conserved Plasmodium protein, unknown function [Plasmodium gallinaceum]
MTKLQNYFFSLSKENSYKVKKSCRKKKKGYIHRCSNIRKFLKYDKCNKLKNCYQYINLKEFLIYNFSENYKNNNNNNGNSINKNEVNKNNLNIFINDLFNSHTITSMYIFEYVSLIGWSNGIISIFDKYLNNILNKKISDSTIKNISMNKKGDAICFMDNLHNLFLIYVNIRNNLKESNNNLFFYSNNLNCKINKNKIDQLYYINEEKFMNLNEREQSFIKAFIYNKIITYNIKYLNSCVINPFFDNYHNNNVCILSSNKIVSILHIYEFHTNNTVLFKEHNILNFYWYHCYIFICTEYSIFVINFFDKTKVAQIFLDSYNYIKTDLSNVQINRSYINEKISKNEENYLNDTIYNDKRIKELDNPHEQHKCDHVNNNLNKGKLEYDYIKSEYSNLVDNMRKENNSFLVHTCSIQKSVYVIAKEKNIKIIKIEKINGIEKINILRSFYLDHFILSICAFPDNNNFGEKGFFISVIIYNEKIFKENEKKQKIKNNFLEHQILTNKNSLIYKNSIKINRINDIYKNNSICNYNSNNSINIYNNKDNYDYFKNYLSIFQYTSFNKDIFDNTIKTKSNSFNDSSLYIYGYNTFLQFRPKTIKESFFELILENKRNSKSIFIILNDLKKNINYKKELNDIGLLLIFSFFKFKKYFLATKIFLTLHKHFYNKKKIIYDIIKIFFLHKRVYILSLFYIKLQKKKKDSKRMYYRMRGKYRMIKRKKKKIKSILYLYYLTNKLYEDKPKEKTKEKIRKNKKKKKILCVQNETKRKKNFSFFITKKLFNKFLVFLLCTNVYHFKNIYENSSNCDLNANLLCKHIIFLLKDNFKFINKKFQIIYNSFRFTLRNEKKKNYDPSNVSYKKSGTEKKILLDILLDIYFKFNIYPFNICNENNLILFNEQNEKCKKIRTIKNFLNYKFLKKNHLAEKDCYRNFFHHEYNNKKKNSKNMKYVYNEKTDYINVERNSYNLKKKNKKLIEIKNKEKIEKKEIVKNEENVSQNEIMYSNNSHSYNDTINGSLYNYAFFKNECNVIKKVEILKILLAMKNEKVFIYLKQCEFQVFKEIINKNIMKLCNLNIKKTVKLLIIKKENKNEYFFDPHKIVKKLKKNPFFLYNFLKEIEDVKYISIYINLILFLMFIFEPLLLMNFLKIYYKYVSFKKILFLISFFNYIFSNYNFLKNKKNSYYDNNDKKNNEKIVNCTNNNHLEDTSNINTEISSNENQINHILYKKDKYIKEKENILNESHSLINIYNGNIVENHSIQKSFDSSRSCFIFFKDENVMLLYKYLLNEYVQKQKLIELFNLVKGESINYKNKINFFLNLKAFIYLKFGYVNRAIKIYLKLSNYLQIFLIMNYHNLTIDERVKKKIKDYLSARYYATSYFSPQKIYLNKKWNSSLFSKKHTIKKDVNLFIKDEYFSYIDKNKEIMKYKNIIIKKKKFNLKKKCNINKLKHNIYHYGKNVYFSRKKNKIHYKDSFIKIKKGIIKSTEKNEIKPYGIYNIFHDEMNKNKEMKYVINENLEKYIIKNVNSNILDKEIMCQLYSEKKKKKKKKNMYFSKNRQIFKKTNNEIYYKRDGNQYLNKKIVIKNYFIDNINYEMNYLTMIYLLEDLIYKNELYDNYNKILIDKKKSIFNFLNEIKKKGYSIYNGKAKKELKKYELNLLDINDYYFLNEDLKESDMLAPYFRNDNHFKNNEKIYHIQKQIPPNYYLYDQMYRNPFISNISSFCSSCLNNIYIDYFYINKKKIKNNNIVFFFCNHVYHLNCLKKKKIICNICY